MTTTLTKVQQFLDSGDSDGVREEVAKISVNLTKIDTSVRDFATLLSCGSQEILEICLGVLGRELIKRDSVKVSNEVIWLFLTSVLSRHNITSNSSSRVSIITLASYVKDWELPIFALLSPAIDSFLKVSLAAGNPLISEQTLDFISTWGENYAKAPRTRKQLIEFESLISSVLDEVDDEDIQKEWAEGIKIFFQIARQHQDDQYSDRRIWSDASNLLEEIYNPAVLNADTVADYYKVQDNICQLITSCLAAMRIILVDDGLSVTSWLDGLDENLPLPFVNNKE
ncbi:MAG: hypothetical protein ACKPGJ_02545 [Dolichospermum sp.]